MALKIPADMTTAPNIAQNPKKGGGTLHIYSAKEL